MKKITCLFLNLSAIMIFFFCGVKLCAQSYTYDKDVYENSAELYVNGDKDLKALLLMYPKKELIYHQCFQL